MRHFALAEREYGTGVGPGLGLNSETFDAHVAGEPVEVWLRPLKMARGDPSSPRAFSFRAKLGRYPPSTPPDLDA